MPQKRKSRAKPLPDTRDIEDHRLVWDPDYWTREALKARGFLCQSNHCYHPDHWRVRCERFFVARSREAAASKLWTDDGRIV